jgi:O-methyltransferase
VPFVRTQSILRKILPGFLFTFIYRIACYLYHVWVTISDPLYYNLLYAFYMLTGADRQKKRLLLIKKILPYTMVGRNGLLITYDIAYDIESRGIDGCFVECGVARGGCSALMALITKEDNNNRKSWLFDSFEGLPEQTVEDEYEAPVLPMPEDKSAKVVAPGYCLGTFEEVEDLLFSKLGLNKDNIFMVKGWFEDTLPVNSNKVGDIAVLRIDGDWYSSTKCCLDNLYDNVITGGYVIIDDYESVIGCKKAVDEFIANHKLNVKLVFDKRGGCYFVKPG